MEFRGAKYLQRQLLNCLYHPHPVAITEIQIGSYIQIMRYFLLFTFRYVCVPAKDNVIHRTIQVLRLQYPVVLKTANFWKPKLMDGACFWHIQSNKQRQESAAVEESNQDAICPFFYSECVTNTHGMVMCFTFWVDA